MEEIQKLPAISTLHGLFAQARAEPATVTIFKGWTRLTTDEHGEMQGAPMQGFYAAETHLLSHYEMKVNGVPVKHRLAVQLAANEWSSTGAVQKSGDSGNLKKGTLPKGSIEVRVLRRIDEGWAEQIIIANNGVPSRKIDFELSLVAPILDSEFQEEMKQEAKLCKRGFKAKLIQEEEWKGFQFNRVFGQRTRPPTDEFRRLFGNYSPKKGDTVSRGIDVLFRLRKNSPKARLQFKPGNSNVFRATTTLGAREEICIEVKYEPIVNGTKLYAPDISGLKPLPRESLQLSNPVLDIDSSNATFNLVLGQAMSDLRDLKLPVFGKTEIPDPERYVAFIAGVPRYIGLFGRDNLITAWQSACTDGDMFDPVLSRIAAFQGIKKDDWRDEEVNRLLHERRINPCAEIGKTNRDLYYGDVTSTPFFVLALSSFYRWTGNLDALRKHAQALENCLNWILTRLKKGEGYIYYAPALSRLKDENRNQAWKDSGDAIVDHEGRICVPPLAVIEVQAYAYQALVESVELLKALGSELDTEALLNEAKELKARFNRDFWVAEESSFAMALDGKGRKISSKASNMGHCLATEIVDEEKIPLVVKALMSEELFSGWGIRTLSNKNPGYDPYSYHRGSVWPVENAIIADGFSMHGYCEEANHIMTAQLGLAAMFQHMRLPEVISGHARSPESPVPGIYSYANLLQSWSVSAIAQYLQVMLGLMPRAEQGVLYLKPHLPEWLSWIELKNLKVGHAKLHLRFWRDEKGHTQWSVVNQSGELEVRSVFASKAKAA